MDNKVLITINNEDGTINNKIECDSYQQFRILWFDEEGRIHILGKLPWKVMKAPLKEWAQTWAETHAGEFETIVKQYRPETTDEEIISLLHAMENEAVKLLVAENGKRDMTVASHMVRELLRAVTITVKNVANEIKTIWEFTQSIGDKTDSNSVLGWLFQRR